MSLYRSDILVKELRVQKGLTQKQLCEGICTQEELSRIERGKRRPTYVVLSQLLQRMGEDPSKYYTDIITTEDKEIIDIKAQLTNLLREKTEQADSQVELMVLNLENSSKFKTGVNRQFLLHMKSTLAFHRKDYANMHQYAVDALQITKPSFDEELINSYILSIDEIKLVNLIAASYGSTSFLEKSTEILLKLKVSMDMNYLEEEQKYKIYLHLLHNLTKNLGLLKRYTECVPLCESGITLSNLHRDSFFPPLFIFNKACCLLYLGQTEDGICLANEAYAVFSATKRNTELSMLSNFMQNEFNVTLPLA